MERRCKLMSVLGMRNLSGYDTKIKDAEKFRFMPPKGADVVGE